MKTFFPFIIALLLIAPVYAQEVPSPTSANDRLESFERRKSLSPPHILQHLEFKSIGPTIMGGRVTDIEVNPEDASEFFIAYASGGLWKTENNGQSYTSLFDHEMVMTIGDIAVNWSSGEIWIGSGENNSSRSSYAGMGMFYSADTGKTWQHLGLEESHHIGRIILHPSDPSTIYAAVLGHLYSNNEERGVYKSSDGGKSWERLLYIDDNTGAIDLIMHPGDPEVLYAAMWERHRKAWDFTEGGPKSGIYKTVDGGKTWKHWTGEGSGFPEGLIGRIGLAFSNDGKWLYCSLDNQNRRSEKKEEEDELRGEDFRNMTVEAFMKLSSDKIDDYLKNNDFPKGLTADSVRNMVRRDELKVSALADYIQDANAQLFDTEVIGAEVYRCSAGLKDWKREWRRTHEEYIDDFVYTYGYYFGQIRTSPTDPNKLFITGVPLLRSDDGGKTFKSINRENQHVDHHALWLNPKKDGHMINGNDGGINISYDDGENWVKVKSPPVGQFYTVSVDNAKPYRVYGGLQDNGVWRGPSGYKESSRWHQSGHYPYTMLMGGDGFKVEIDGRDNETIYTGFQFGHYYRLKTGGKRVKVTPRHSLGERPLRFNWQTPIYLSRHHQDVLYFGSNKFHRSLDRGDNYDLVSADLTLGGKEGDVAFGTITTIHESPLVFGLIYLGTDDGLIHRSDDLGYHWSNISGGLPKDLWVTSVVASAHDTDRVYVTLNGYRWDHFDAYVFVSEDRGESWQRIAQGLPMEPVNVIEEDPSNEDILYVGTDNGLYISIDRGQSFMMQRNGIPAVAVHDLAIQEREGDLVVGTHGRSLYRCHIGHLQKLTSSVREKGIHFFPISSVTYNDSWGKKYNEWKETVKAEMKLAVYVKEAGSYKMEVSTEDGLSLNEMTLNLDEGLNYPLYHLNVLAGRYKAYEKALKKKDEKAVVKAADDKNYYLHPGDYLISISHEKTGAKAEQKLVVKKRK